MTEKKLTYSGTRCNNYIYFSFVATVFDTEMVTKKMGITPTSLMIKSHPVPKSTAWKYKIEAGESLDLETTLETLINMFEKKVEVINQLKKEYNLNTKLQIVIDIDINPEASTPYFGLNKRTVDFLGNTKTEVDFDLYKVDTIGLL